MQATIPQANSTGLCLFLIRLWHQRIAAPSGHSCVHDLVHGCLGLDLRPQADRASPAAAVGHHERRIDIRNDHSGCVCGAA